MELSIVLPCLNEARTLVGCIEEAKSFLAESGIVGEVVVADNGSSDGSPALARSSGARVVDARERGYGSAIMAGVSGARGRYVAIGDADQSYDFSSLAPFINRLRDGADLVVGNRFLGGIERRAMPLLHRYLGNPVLSFIGRLFFRVDLGDFHCGLRAANRRRLLDLALATKGMEFASEMIVKAALAEYRIEEVPTKLRVDGRDRRPHLRTWSDGWRHLRFLLLFSPRWLFFYPGLVAIAAGLAGHIVLLMGPVGVVGVELDVHTLLYTSASMLGGAQAVFFGIFAKLFGLYSGTLPPDPRFERAVARVPFESWLALGALLSVSGFALSLWALFTWGQEEFGGLVPSDMMRVTIPAVTMFLMGLQVVLGGFMMGVLRLDRQGWGSAR
ncbi:glycosyltransferase family 2 protein [Pseudomarimonas salicorniae]|uniref:Glycosyltransferase family 2 protein n=1 Tax=Pseudomarimonas salicorniae TaxID=2933270 RepID=A0ABT0GFK2_9GAMM|nr:glycosyltransferase family 2 protein [Lysobacter sp. CAU 1642]MCK7593319.1 glycosyltransferase family 2 protein [Lysobacter sp. CAU 1642]